jgi:hypothetical protein
MTSDKDPAEEPAKGLDPAAVEAWVVASRARQGLGPKITDPATLARIAVLARDDQHPPLAHTRPRCFPCRGLSFAEGSGGHLPLVCRKLGVP